MSLARCADGQAGAIQADPKRVQDTYLHVYDLLYKAVDYSRAKAAAAKGKGAAARP
jgi:hypothetical protein